MGRSSSTGHPYLVLRPDAGQYTYWRSLRADIAPLVMGDILLSWAGKTRALCGSRIVKLSLKTGDTATARVRWTEVHPQVEALVQMALVRLNKTAGTAQPKPAPARLSPEQIATMAAQVHHDILASHDRSWVDPSFASPLAGVILRGSRADPSPSALDAARRAADALALKRAKEALVGRDVLAVDQRITTFDCELDPALFDDEALRSGRVRQFSAEQLEYLLRAEANATVVPSELDRLLAENNVDLPREGSDRRVLALAVLRAKVRAGEILANREHGAAIETPARPPHLEPSARPSGTPTLTVMQKRWIELARPGRKHIADHARYVGYFIELFGDIPVGKVTGEQVKTFRDKLLLCPRNVPLALSKATMDERIAWSRQNPRAPSLGRGTINAKGIGSISALVTTAIKDEILTINPCNGKHLSINAGDMLERRAYDLDDLKRAFQSPAFYNPPKLWKAGAGAAARWLPLLALFTGARLEELGQLLVSDVKVEDGIHYLDITDIPDEAAAKRDERKSVKTTNARRRVPIHAELIRCGFLDYAARQRATGFTRLFPQLQEYEGRLTRDWSKYWGRYADKFITTDPTKTFHSFRHGFIQQLSNKEVDDKFIKALVGHSQVGVISNYRRQGFALATLNNIVQSLSYPGLDLSHLYPH